MQMDMKPSQKKINQMMAVMNKHPYIEGVLPSYIDFSN